MGICMSTNAQKKNLNLPSSSNNEQKMGIFMLKSLQTQLHFNHSALQNSTFLLKKFSQSSSQPQQVNLTFMILNVQINSKSNQVQINFINLNQVNIYFVLGGEQSVSNTGLTVQITKIKYAQKIIRKQPSAKQGDRILIVPSRINSEPIFIIMQPVLKNKQSIFLINRYNFSPNDKTYKIKSQSLQWNSLAFDLQDIYGSDSLFKCNSGEQCSVCLSSPANIILTPCRHMCMCKDCSKSYQHSSTKCPICRTEFRAIIGYN